MPRFLATCANSSDMMWHLVALIKRSAKAISSWTQSIFSCQSKARAGPCRSSARSTRIGSDTSWIVHLLIQAGSRRMKCPRSSKSWSPVPNHIMAGSVPRKRRLHLCKRKHVCLVTERASSASCSSHSHRLPLCRTMLDLCQSSHLHYFHRLPPRCNHLHNNTRGFRHRVRVAL